MASFSPFTKRRVIRLLISAVGVLAFILIQRWQISDAPILSLPTLPDIFSVTSTKEIPSSGLDPSTPGIFTTNTARGVRAMVVRVVDGDTIEAKISSTGEDVKVRFLGMNTPESVDPRRPVQCFGHEASNYNKRLIEGKEVWLVDDPKADDRDKYNRLLRNVVRVEDNLDVNATLVDQGYANAYLTFPLDVKRKAQMRALEAAAKAAGRGLWGIGTCDGKK